MPITGRNLNEVARTLTNHLNSVLARTITQKPLIPFSAPPSAIAISFRDHVEGSVAPLRTKYGRMDLYVSQLCDAVQGAERNSYSLRTLAYVYSLKPIAMVEPLFRWEYVRSPVSDAEGNIPKWCRHHIQGDLRITFTDDRGNEQQIRLNDWHTPTGWITIEEIIRFCIVDLDVPTGAGWEPILADSSQRFRDEFSVQDDW